MKLETLLQRATQQARDLDQATAHVLFCAELLIEQLNQMGVRVISGANVDLAWQLEEALGRLRNLTHVHHL